VVRKTKAQAQATRCAILDAAEHLFQARGVSATSLQDIAAATGVTRGAIYWHFKDKGDLFNAMMNRVCLPMEDSAARLGDETQSAPLAVLRAHLAEIFARIAADAQLRRVLEIATRKIEYLDELTAVREHQRQVRHDYRAQLERTLAAAQRRGEVSTSAPASELAIGLLALMDGLIQTWIVEPDSFDLQAVGGRAVDRYLAGLATPDGC
jgi:TetR/AcrR family acrAB operon transcriptional repressor